MFGILVTTLPQVPSVRIKKVLGLVYGLTVRSRGIGGQFVAALETMAGGEITAYTEEASKARIECIRRMVEKAKEMGANAIIGVDFETSDILNGVATLFASYGTAVVLEEIGETLIDLKDDVFFEEKKYKEISIDEMYNYLVDFYSRTYGNYGIKKLKNDIESEMMKGVSRERAIRNIYSRLHG